MKRFFVTFLAFVSTAAFAATDAEIGNWADEEMAEAAKSAVVKEGKAQTISVYTNLHSIDDKKVPGKIYWDVDCFRLTQVDGTMKSIKKTCMKSLSIVKNKIWEDGFGRSTMKTCYVGNSEKVCGIIAAESKKTMSTEGHGYFDNVACNIVDDMVKVTYETHNDYDGNADSKLDIPKCK